MMKHPQWSPTDPAVNHYLGVMFATTSACRLLLLTHRRDIAQSFTSGLTCPHHITPTYPHKWSGRASSSQILRGKRSNQLSFCDCLVHNWVPRNLDLYFYINITKICGLVLKCGTIPMYLRLVHGDFKGCTSIFTRVSKTVELKESVISSPRKYINVSKRGAGQLAKLVYK